MPRSLGIPSKWPTIVHPEIAPRRQRGAAAQRFDRRMDDDHSFLGRWFRVGARGSVVVAGAAQIAVPAQAVLDGGVEEGLTPIGLACRATARRRAVSLVMPITWVGAK